MAFLDNSGDIILDAVLTDTGRYKLAKGDGSFKIVKFALGDDEIDYSLYDKENPSGSVYYDLNILQTPILEAFTDNASALKSHLLTINRTDLLFLPVIKINDKETYSKTFQDKGFFAVAVDQDTEAVAPFNSSSVEALPGAFFPQSPLKDKNLILLHQGLDTTKLSPVQDLSPDLVESMYMIEIDNRLGFLQMSGSILEPSYIDDDQIATYLVTQQKNPDMISKISTSINDQGRSPIRGPRGTSLQFQIGASTELQTSTFLFQELGFTSGSLNLLDSTIRVTGARTGYRIDIPVRYYKKI